MESKTWMPDKFESGGFKTDVDSGYPEVEKALFKLMHEQFNLFCKKQRDYGPGNINAFGEFGILVRASDKFERLKNLARSQEIPANESIDDTWMDIATYALIALLVRRGQWPKS